jgi:dienelactone hydrolase
MMNFKFFTASLVAALFFAQCTSPSPQTDANTEEEIMEVKLNTETVLYSTDSTEMKGYFAYDENSTDKRPGILVVHEWWGQTDYARKRADMLAELGYVALAVDMYGGGATAEHPQEAMGFSSAVMQNMPESKARFEAAYKTLAAHPMVEQGSISAVGYCFGGSVAMTMANTGMELDGVAAFHSGVNLPNAPGADLKASMLVQNGGADPMITAEDAERFKQAMDSAGGKLEYISYPGVLHAYTNPEADALGEKYELPLKYNAEADSASWDKMKAFLAALYR